MHNKTRHPGFSTAMARQRRIVWSVTFVLVFLALMSLTISVQLELPSDPTATTTTTTTYHSNGPPVSQQQHQPAMDPSNRSLLLSTTDISNETQTVPTNDSQSPTTHENNMPTRISTASLTSVPLSDDACPAAFAVHPLGLWQHYMAAIHAASRAQGDASFANGPRIAQVLRHLSPRLPLSVQTSVRDRSSVRHALHVLRQRYEYILQVATGTVSTTHNVLPPPPFHVLVVGGSVTMGVGCYPEVRRGRCAWPDRLQDLVQSFVTTQIQSHSNITTIQSTLPHLVEVHNLAAGGTNTVRGHNSLGVMVQLIRSLRTVSHTCLLFRVRCLFLSSFVPSTHNAQQ
jgi:hypothetical protein